MSFDYQPILKGELVELRPLSTEDYDGLSAVAADPLIWEQHPVRNRHEESPNQSAAAVALLPYGIQFRS